MEIGLQFADRKAELEEKIRALEDERAGLLAEIPTLKEKVTTLRLENKARSLENEVAALRSERTTLEEEISQYVQSPSQPIEEATTDYESKNEIDEQVAS